MIFDTDILINAQRGYEDANEIIVSESSPAISAVAYMEYAYRCRDKRELTNFELMLKSSRFFIYEIDKEISVTARGYVRRFSLSHGMQMGDALVAATALIHSETLCTANLKHFRQISEIELYPYNPHTP